MAAKHKKKDPVVTMGHSNCNNTFIISNAGVDKITAASPAGEEGGEMEHDLVRVFRGFTMREKTRFMQGAYDFEDACTQDREEKRKAQEEKGGEEQPQ